jgi:hypothetical protein
MIESERKPLTKAELLEVLKAAELALFETSLAFYETFAETQRAEIARLRGEREFSRDYILGRAAQQESVRSRQSAVVERYQWALRTYANASD